MDINIFSLKSIIRCEQLSKTKDEKEHTTLIYKRNRKLFNIKDVVAPKNLRWPKLGLTLDEEKDYILIKNIFEYFQDNKNIFTCLDIIKILKQKKKIWKNINKNIKRTIVE